MDYIERSQMPNLPPENVTPMPEITTVTLSPKEVSQQLGFCTKTVLRLIKEGKIAPVYRINKRVIRVPQQAVDRYLYDCRMLDLSPPG